MRSKVQAQVREQPTGRQGHHLAPAGGLLLHRELIRRPRPPDLPQTKEQQFWGDAQVVRAWRSLSLEQKTQAEEENRVREAILEVLNPPVASPVPTLSEVEVEEHARRRYLVALGTWRFRSVGGMPHHEREKWAEQVRTLIAARGLYRRAGSAGLAAESEAQLRKIGYLPELGQEILAPDGTVVPRPNDLGELEL